MTDGTTPVWEDHEAWGPRRWYNPTLAYAINSADQMVEAAADAGPGMPACVVYDEEMADNIVRANKLPAAIDPHVMRDTDPFARQDDKGPYHWMQGPDDVPAATVRRPAPTPPVVANTSPENVQPGKLPRKGMALTTTNLRLRRRAGRGNKTLGILPTGTTVELTGGRERLGKSLWVRVKIKAIAPIDANADLPQGEVWASDTLLAGWVDAEYLAIPASEYIAHDMPPVTHEWLWYLEDAGGLDAETVRRTLTAISDDPRGPLRSGLDMREVLTSEEAHILVRMVDDACNGAAGCYYKRMGEKARVDIAKEWWNTAWLSRVWLHEGMGHGATRAYDHYQGAPQYPRDDYFGIMGNWEDQYGDHAWPDEDDIENFRAWLAGRSDLVYLRDQPKPE